MKFYFGNTFCLFDGFVGSVYINYFFPFLLVYFVV